MCMFTLEGLEMLQELCKYWDLEFGILLLHKRLILIFDHIKHLYRKISCMRICIYLEISWIKELMMTSKQITQMIYKEKFLVVHYLGRVKKPRTEGNLI